MCNLEPRVSAIVVLGMHRSGTSSVAGALVRLGGGAPAHLMDPAPCNERGFWESPLIMALNDEILEAAGSHWADCRRFDHRRVAEPAASELRARAAATLISELGRPRTPSSRTPGCADSWTSGSQCSRMSDGRRVSCCRYDLLLRSRGRLKPGTEWSPASGACSGFGTFWMRRLRAEAPVVHSSHGRAFSPIVAERLNMSPSNLSSIGYSRPTRQ